MSVGSFTSLVKGGVTPAQNSEQTTMLGQVALAPASSQESLFVVVPGLSLAFPYEVPVGQWSAPQSLPAAGATCLVLIDDKGDAWVPLIVGGVSLNARVNRMTGMALVANQWTAVPFDTTQNDPSASAATGRYVCKRPGVYAIATQMRVTGVKVAAAIAIFKTGVLWSEGDYVEPLNVGEVMGLVAADNAIQCATGDYIETRVWVDSTSTGASIVAGSATP